MTGRHNEVYSENPDLLRKEIKDKINNLCNNEKGSYMSLKYKANELQDFCGEDTSCYNKITENIIPPNFRTCRNAEFSRDLDVIGLNIGNPMTFKRIRVEREVSNSGGMTNSNMLFALMPCFIIGLYYFKDKKASALVLMVFIVLALFMLIN